MDATTFTRQKIEWLNAISKECGLSSTAFRVAYLIADHLNRVVGSAWPSRATLADKICLSVKSINRAVRQLEDAGWLRVARTRNQSNHYRIAWPEGRGPKPKKKPPLEEDTNVPESGQNSPPVEDRNVRQSYLTNQSRTFSSRLGEGSNEKPFADRGKYELEIMNRFGPGTAEMLQQLDEIAPAALSELCRMQQDGSLTRAEIEAARLAVVQTKSTKENAIGRRR